MAAFEDHLERLLADRRPHRLELLGDVLPVAVGHGDGIDDEVDLVGAGEQRHAGLGGLGLDRLGAQRKAGDPVDANVAAGDQVLQLRHLAAGHADLAETARQRLVDERAEFGVGVDGSQERLIGHLL